MGREITIQYNSNATNQDIVTLADRFAGIPSGDTTSFPIVDKTLHANQALKIIFSWIYSVYGGWVYQDSNDLSNPYGDINAVANTSKISIPTEALDIIGFAWLDSTVNEYRPLEKITIEEIQRRGKTLNNFENVPGIPRYYLPMGNYAYIFPALDTSLSSGFRAYFSRATSLFATTDTTKTPGFLGEFHEAVAVYMALQYAEINQLANVTALRKKWSNDASVDPSYPDGYEQRIKKFYKSRFLEAYPKAIQHNNPDYVQTELL